jgi:hypothetical protein
LPPVSPATIVRRVPVLAAEVLVFDILIANNDRHAGNLAHLTESNRLEVFDHSHALLGRVAGQGIAHLSSLTNSLGVLGPPNRHCLLDVIDSADRVVRAVEKVRSTMRTVDVARICREAGLLEIGLTVGEARILGKWMIDRAQRLGDLVTANRAQFRGIPAADWPIVI